MQHLTLFVLVVVAVVAIDAVPVKIQSKNFPSHFFGGASPAAISTSASLFNVVCPGLTGEAGTVSFQSASQPNSYLRHYDFTLFLEDKDTGRNAKILPKDATFRIVEDKFFPGFVSFESVNFPGRFVRHQGGTLKLHPDDGSDVMHNDASFKILPVSVKIQSKNFPSHFFGGANPAAISTSASLFNVVCPGLIGKTSTVSFQSASQPNSYLRHYDSTLFLEDKDTGRNANIFPEDATFRIVENKFFPGFVSFESVNFPGRFVRHQGGTLKLHPDDGSDVMHNDASFKILPTEDVGPAAPGGCWCVNKKGK